MLKLEKRLNYDLLLIFIIWIFSLAIDIFWLSLNNLPPAWDQSTHLASAFKLNHLFNDPRYFDSLWWKEIYDVTPSYRGPFTYLSTLPLLKIFGPSFKSAILINQFFNGILLVCIYLQGSLFHKRSTGLWAAFLCSVSPAFLVQRTDYLIDLSLTSLITCSWLFLCLWRTGKFNKWISAILSGLFFGFVFLCKPTGLLFFIIPIFLIIANSIIDFKRKSFSLIIQFIVMISTSVLVFFPWFSQNWLTIITSINKARRWGILYQDGLESDSLSGWLYYINLIPDVFGKFLFIIIITGIIYYFLERKNIYIFGNLKFNRRLIWFVSFPLGSFLICIFMSTKDLRFILPLLPQLFILVSIFISSIKFKWNLVWRVSISIIGLLGVLWYQFGIGLNIIGENTNFPVNNEEWPLEEIVKTIKLTSPYSKSTVAVLSDSKYLNAFNIDAEGIRQSDLVSGRQIYYQSDYLINEINNYDWYLIKSGDQGIMSNKYHLELGEFIKNSSDFKKVKVWNLPDKSHVSLFRRSNLSLVLKRYKCKNNDFDFSIEDNNINYNIKFKGITKDLINAQFIVEVIKNKKNFFYSQSIGNGLINKYTINDNECLDLSQSFNKLSKDKYISSDSYIKNAYLISDFSYKEFDNNYNYIINNINNENYMINRLDAFFEISTLLKEGRLDTVFSSIGILNQGDPDQIYLKDAESVLTFLLKNDPNNIDYIYALGLSQVLQKKAGSAAINFNRAYELDKTNQYPLIYKAFLQTYQLKGKESNESLRIAEVYNNNSQSIEIINTLKIVNNLITFNFLDFYFGLKEN